MSNESRILIPPLAAVYTPDEERPAHLRKSVCLNYFPTGSSVICTPPVLDTDRDMAVLVKSLVNYGALLEAMDWTVNYDDPEYLIHCNGEIAFITARKGIENLIVFESLEAFVAFHAATFAAKAFNLQHKWQRVLLFQAVMGNRGDDTSPFHEAEPF